MIKLENDTPDFVFVPFTLLNALNYSITDDDKVLLRVQHSYPAFDINDREMTLRKQIKLRRKHSILISGNATWI